MGSRFQRNSHQDPGQRFRASTTGGEGFGEWWAAVGIVALATIAALSLGGKSVGDSAIPVALAVTKSAFATNDPSAEIARSLQAAELALAEFDRSLRSLCREPVLIALELEPDCETGVLTIGDAMFDGAGGSQLTIQSREDVRAAMTTYLEALRRKPALWESLEALEIRGHADPRAYRNAYTTNLVGSQQRSLGVLYFLTSEEGLSARDQEDLQRLATVSGASFSRPPKSCPEEVRRCYPEWRRVEILPVFSEARRRREWSTTVESVQAIVERAASGPSGGQAASTP